MQESHAAERTPPLNVNGGCVHVVCAQGKSIQMKQTTGTRA